MLAEWMCLILISWSLVFVAAYLMGEKTCH